MQILTSTSPIITSTRPGISKPAAHAEAGPTDTFTQSSRPDPNPLKYLGASLGAVAGATGGTALAMTGWVGPGIAGSLIVGGALAGGIGLASLAVSSSRDQRDELGAYLGLVFGGALGAGLGGGFGALAGGALSAGGVLGAVGAGALGGVLGAALGATAQHALTSNSSLEQAVA